MAKKKKDKSAASAEIYRIRGLWRDAKLGDQAATNELVMTLLGFGSPDAFARSWGALKIEDARSNERKRMVVKQKKPSTPWERAKSTLSTGRVVMVGGGLPSLGKHSK